MNYKTKQFDIKSVSDTGEITGYFSVYSPVADSYGDCIAPGCFSETIKAWDEKGKHIPLVWNHNMDDPELIIGQVDKIEDDEHGPLMTAHFYDTAKAQAARNLMKEGSVYQFSYAYSVDAAREPNENEKAADPNIRQVLESVSLMEITVTPTPAQPLAEMASIKSEEPEKKEIATVTVKVVPELDEDAFAEVMEKAGRRNSQKDADAIREAISLLQGVLGELEDTTDEGKDNAKANGSAPEEPKQSNPEIEELIKRTNEILRRNQK